MCSLNTGLKRIGEVRYGTIIPSTVPVAADVTVGSVDLPAGRWIVIANVWLPTEIVAHLTVSAGYDAMGMYRIPQAVGIVYTTKQTTQPVMLTQWSSGSIYITDGTICAIRIA